MEAGMGLQRPHGPYPPKPWVSEAPEDGAAPVGGAPGHDQLRDLGEVLVGHVKNVWDDVHGLNCVYK